MKSNEVANPFKEETSLDNKLKELLAENEQNKANIVSQEQEIAAEHKQAKQAIEEFEQKLAEIFNEWKKVGLAKDKIIYKQKELVREIQKRIEKQTQFYIKEYTELHTITARQKKELKDWAEKQKQIAQEEIRKVKRLVWIVGIISSVVSIVLTMLGCYLLWGKK